MDNDDERLRWESRYAAGEGARRAPSTWVIEAALRLPEDALIVDIAGGGGRHAAPLVRAGRRVIVLDFAEGGVRAAVQEDARVTGLVADVLALPFAAGTLDAIVVTNFLERAAFPHYAALLRPGGTLIYETYTTAHADLVARGVARAPRSMRFLLRPGELTTLVAPLVVAAAREGLVRDDAGERCCASVVARKLAA